MVLLMQEVLLLIGSLQRYYNFNELPFVENEYENNALGLWLKTESAISTYPMILECYELIDMFKSIGS